MISIAPKIEKFLSADLEAVPGLQPEGWPDIFPSIQYYCAADFCFPLKATVNGTTAGMGTAIILGNTAWLAHIIVSPQYRNAGIGTALTKALVELVQHTPCKTILLIATALGEPVYKKLGFEVQTQYVFFDEGALPKPGLDVQEIKPFEKQKEKDLLQLDRRVSGENRKKLLEQHYESCLVFLEDRALKGFYMPTLGEGLVVADTHTAGFELMKYRTAEAKKICIPADNLHGVDLLTNHGFKEVRKASRMVLGEKLEWHGSKIYSRIGGNLG
ncbi:GNAT family N-acetyltransferase [Chryseolinea sp. H1M3-3]|uniref:GNAT family N-acetyltransferase n=1 Tax=Chryseolinea sp. H1M3-3 TaxID=3034144 RepID=UPI0023EDFD54|nr:GNAT family N-acetyltransferase [Chryseolinea sp. H1M3-3]